MPPPDTLTSLIAETLSCIALWSFFYFTSITSTLLALLITIAISTSVNFLVHKTSEAVLDAFDRAVDERICREIDVHNVRLVRYVAGRFKECRRTVHDCVAVQIERALRKQHSTVQELLQDMIDASIETGLQADRNTQQITLQRLFDTRFKHLYDAQQKSQQDGHHLTIDSRATKIVEQKLTDFEKRLTSIIDTRFSDAYDEQCTVQQAACQNLITNSELAAKRMERRQLYTSLGRALGKLKSLLTFCIDRQHHFDNTHYMAIHIQDTLMAFRALGILTPSTSTTAFLDKQRDELHLRLAAVAYDDYEKHTLHSMQNMLDVVSVALESSHEDEVLGEQVRLADSQYSVG
ncbi:hypothetical protein LTR97_009019 [Elasticomyces elasticus]|uniref:Uncharacterized protein n=1 Tax=Elasticomyces elasticus TaxID=574655 RepID=A0AAN7W4M6_9PEZI|nr:hypothetical protein LTR97_009019 [Elasticomyces elasticus]